MHTTESTTPSAQPSLVITYIAAPDQPGAVTATRADRSANVTWTQPADNGSAITGYTIKAFEGGTTLRATTTAAAGATSAAITGLVNGTSYVISVYATNAIGTSQPGNSNSVIPASVPIAPSTITGTRGDGQVAVTWSAAGDNGDPVNGYQLVTYNPNNSVFSTQNLPVQTSATVTGLTNGTAYTFTVAGKNGLGTGSPSAHSAAVTPAGLPFAPTALSATYGDSTAYLTWTASGNNGDPISNYSMKAYAGATLISTTASGGAATTGTVTGLTNGVTYTFTVSAINSVGTGSPSADSAPGTPGLPGQPTNVVGTRGDQSVALTWTAPSGNGNALSSNAVKAYNGATLVSTTTAAGSATSATITGLTNGTAYTFTVTATNVIGNGPESAASAPVTPAGLPGTPTGVTATPADNSAQVNWTPPSANGTPLTSYSVKAYAGATLVQTTPVTAPASGTTVTGLTNGTTYTFTVTATNSVGAGATSAASNAVTPAGLPAAPTVTATAGDTTASVSWNAVSGNGSTITGYTLKQYSGATLLSTVPLSPSTLSYNATGLTNGTAYTFTVSATNGVGTGPTGSSPAVTPAGLPLTPTGVSATPGDQSATVNWTQPANNGSAITSYTVRAYAGATLVQTVSAAPGTSKLVTGLTNGTAYTFTVTATNGVGSGTASTATTAVTPAGLPAAPSVTATAGDTTASVSWNAVAPNGSALTGYTLQKYDSTGLLATISLSAATLSYNATGLTNGTAYTFTVSATNGVGSGPAGSSSGVTPAGVPFAPSRPAVSPRDRAALVSWVDSNNNGSPVTSFRIDPWVSSTLVSSSTVGAASTSGLVSNLTPGTTYQFMVVAINAVGQSSNSDPVFLSAMGVPDAPSSVTAVAGDGTATVTWTVPAANNSPLLSYQLIVHNPDNSTWTPINADASSTQAVVSGLTDGQTYTIAVDAVNAMGVGAQTLSAGVTPVAPQTPAGAGEYVPVTPTRIVDTITGLGGSNTPIGADQTRTFTVLGVAGIPTSGVSAVVVSVTAVNPSADGWMTVWPHGPSRPGVSQISNKAGVDRATLIVSKVGDAGQLDLYNLTGTAGVIVDAQGYYTDNTVSSAGGTFVPVAPTRVMDTRTGNNNTPTGPLQSNSSRTFTMTGLGGVPASGVSAVVVALGVTNATYANGTYLTAYRTGDARPTTSNVNVHVGDTVSTLAEVPLNSAGQMDLYNYIGTADAFMDVEGYYLSSASAPAQRFVPISPSRIYQSNTAYASNETRTITLAGATDTTSHNVVIPSTGVSAVVLSVQVTGPHTSGYLEGYPTGTSQPSPGSILNYGNDPSASYANAFIAKLGTGGATNIYANAGNFTLILDVEGYFVTVPPTPPAAPTFSSSVFNSGSWTTATSGSVTLADSSSALDHYQYSFDDPALGSPTPQRPTSGTSATFSLSPPGGWHTLYVQAVDTANNLSPTTTISFGAGPGFSSPTAGTHTQRDLTLIARAPSGYVGVTFQYRRSSTDGWTTIPLSDVTKNGAAIAGSWPVTFTAGPDTTPALVWNAARTLAVDGTVTLHACLHPSSGADVCTASAPTAPAADVDVTLDRGGDAHPTATTSFGPGELNLLTGHLTLSTTDASTSGYNSDLNLSRSYNTGSPIRAVPGAANLLTANQEGNEGPNLNDITSLHSTVSHAASPEFSLGHSLQITTAATGVSTDTFASFGDTGTLRNGMKPGHSYTFTTHIYVPSTTGLSGTGWSTRAERAVLFYGASGVYTEVASSPATATNTWQALAIRFTVPSATPAPTEAFIRLYNGTPTADFPGNTTSHSVFYDDSSLTEEGMFGPGWTPSLPVSSAGSSWTGLSDMGTSLVVLHDGDGSDVSFAKGPNSSYLPTGDDATSGLVLTPSQVTSTGAGQWTLTDLDGNTTSFIPTGTNLGPPSIDGPNSYRATTVSQPGNSTSTSYTYDQTTGRVIQMLAPVPAGTDASSCTPTGAWAVGCRALTFSYSTSGHLLGVAVKTTDSSGAVLAVAVACYSYDEGTGSGNTGELLQAWDPRVVGMGASSTCPATPASGSLVTAYAYDSSRRLNKITPPGLAAWNIGFDSSGRVSTVGRTHSSAFGSGTEAMTAVYDVPTTKDPAPANAAFRPDLGNPTTIAAWGQSDIPTTAVAIYGPGDTVSSTDLHGGAEVSYINAAGRITNTASYANGWHFGETSYDSFGNVVRTLSPSNRELALNPSSATGLNLPSDTVAAANALSDVSVYTPDGMDLTDTFGPYHLVTLPDGTSSGARSHSHTSYDNGSELAHPTGGVLHLPVSSYTAASLSQLATATNEVDKRTTTTAYALSTSDATGWTYRQPMLITTDPGGLGLQDVTRYDSATGLPIESRMRSNPTGGGAGSTVTTYYRAGTAQVPSDIPNCINSAWVNLTCKTTPVDATPTAGLPGLVSTQTTSYDYLNRPLTVVETVTPAAGGTPLTRTTTTDYENSGWSPRAHSTSTTTTDTSTTSVPASTLGYDPTSGLQTTVSNGTTTITTGYDDFGRQVSYNDGSGAAATTTAYDTAGRVSAVTDAKGTRTFGYNELGEQRGLPTSLTDSVLGKFTGSYDANGTLVHETWPTAIGVTEDWTTDPTGDTTQLNVMKSATVWSQDTVTSSIHGQWRTETSNIGATTGSAGTDRVNTYDAAGRLSSVQDTTKTVVAGHSPSLACATRSYTFDADSNRLTATSYPAATGGGCQTATGASTVTHAYDTADRQLASGNDSGLQYDTFGRQTTLPASNVAGAAQVNLSYFSNDLVKTMNQQTPTGPVSLTWTLDAAQRQAVRIDGQGHSVTNHYDGGSDSPAWITESTDNNTWTRNISDLAGGLCATNDQSGVVTYQVANLHGDVIATSSPGGTTLATGYASDEFGNAQGPTAGRYGWLGTKQRADDNVGGLQLMGARVYNPSSGRFLQTDPVPGGSANDYDYANQDPVNGFDLGGTYSHSGEPDGGVVWKDSGCYTFHCDNVRSLAQYARRHKKHCGFGCWLHRASRVASAVSTVACFAGPAVCLGASLLSAGLSIGDRVVAGQSWGSVLSGGALDLAAGFLPAARFRAFKMLKIGRLRFATSGWKFSRKRALLQLANYGRSWG